MSGKAWVTLATNDSYALGTLVLGSSLRAVGTAHQLAVMVTKGVSSEMKERLRTAFDLLFEVNILDSQDEANLALLSRPELGLTFTKLHCWRLTQFEKCVFLDADTMVVQNCDELFDREELSAAPDAGWPDCFNSGVFVYRPSLDTFRSLLSFAITHGSFDGGDQGLLNSFFSDWATKDIAFHLPFIYNMCSNAVYSYLPAYKKYGESVKIVHFIGPNKPWLMHFDVETGCVHPPAGFYQVLPLLQKWWDIFFATVHSTLSPAMAQQDAPTVLHHVADFMLGQDSQPFEDPSYGHWDPWETVDLEQTLPPPHEITPPMHTHTPYQGQTVHHVEHVHHAEHHTEHHTVHHHSYVQHTAHIAASHVHEVKALSINFTSGDSQSGDGGGGLHNSHTIETSQQSHPTHIVNSSVENVAQNLQHNSVGHVSSSLFKTDELLSFGHENGPAFVSSTFPKKHDTSLSPQSTEILNDPCLAMHVVNSDAPVVCDRITNQGQSLIDETGGGSKEVDPSPQDAGLAGAFAQLRLGAPRSEAQKVLEEHLRRQNWEQGQADYMGADSFDNIWSKICSTLAGAPGKQSRVKHNEEHTATIRAEDVEKDIEPKIPSTAVQPTQASASETSTSIPTPVTEEKQSSLKI